METYINYIKQYIAVSEILEERLKAIAVEEILSKGHHLLAEGKVCKKMYFLKEGSVRSFSYTKGKDVTHWVYPSNDIFTSWYSYILRTPSKEYLEVIEESTVVISVSYNDWQDLFKEFPELETYERLMIESKLAILDDFYKGYYFLTAREKYELLLSSYPSVVQRANLGHIASMLGISQETLSRIRAKNK